MFKDAVYWNLIPVDPFTGAGSKMKTLRVQDWHKLTPQQLKRLLSVVDLARKRPTPFSTALVCGWVRDYP